MQEAVRIVGNGTLKPRERVSLSLGHRKPDRCPMQISFTPEFARGCARTCVSRPGGPQPARRRQHLRTGARARAGHAAHLASAGPILTTPTRPTGGENAYTDEWGVGWKNAPYETRFGPGSYTEIVGHPLADARALDSYRPPDPQRPELTRRPGGLSPHKGRLLDRRRDRDHHLRDRLGAARPRAHADGFRGRPGSGRRDARHSRSATTSPPRRRLVELGVDMIWTGDDVGAQHRMLISPPPGGAFLKPSHGRVHRRAEAHEPGHQDRVPLGRRHRADHPRTDRDRRWTCSIRCSRASMDPARLKREYGDRLCFWGSIDEQHTLPFGTPERRAPRGAGAARDRRPGRRADPGSTHHVQLDTPLENFWAMVHAIVGEGAAP